MMITRRVYLSMMHGMCLQPGNYFLRFFGINCNPVYPCLESWHGMIACAVYHDGIWWFNWHVTVDTMIGNSWPQLGGDFTKVVLFLAVAGGTALWIGAYAFYLIMYIMTGCTFNFSFDKAFTASQQPGLVAMNVDFYRILFFKIGIILKISHLIARLKVENRPEH